MILEPHPPLSDSHACFNHPAQLFSQLTDDALSPSYLTQVSGSTFDKCKHIVFISKDLENVVGFYENLWLLLKYQMYLHREMFFMCCFTYINTFQS